MPTLLIQARRRRGFTLIELLVVVVIIGILAAIAIPKFQSSKQRAVRSAAASDLRNLAAAEESYLNEHGVYANNPGLVRITASSGVTLSVVQADATGWSATAAYIGGQCALFFGSAPPVLPATAEGNVACD